MPLSEHEQRLLEQIEQALYAEDPKFAASVRTARSRATGHRWIILSILGVLVGLTVVLVALSVKVVALAPIGFVLIVGSCAYAASMLRRRSSVSGNGANQASPKARPAGLRSRMEDRLRRRFDEN
ncbi:MAG TPA: DUF3040 domain-containing protein [Jatrophihabitantaceae bacterium]|nr:DUF3040 domain-containing protein [Jatrophihabitantaceae bacterium]